MRKQSPILILMFLVSMVGFAWALVYHDAITILTIFVIFVVVFVSLISQSFAAILLILSMILSPEINILPLSQSHFVTVRFDDIVIFTFFFTWFFKVAYLKMFSFIKFHPIFKPIYAYIFMIIISTGLAIITTKRIDPIFSALSIVKIIEYAFILLLFINITKTPKQMQLYLGTLLSGAFIVGLYALYQISINTARISAPFEGKGGEANTFGAYLIVILGQTWFSALKLRNKTFQTLSLIASIVIIVLISYTYSRTSYLALIAFLLASLAFINMKQRLVTMIIGIILIVFYSTIIPQAVIKRSSAPFTGNTINVSPSIKVNPSDSMYYRMIAIQRSISQWKDLPLFGRGFGTVLVDSQYFKILVETGIFGTITFLWILFYIFKVCLNSLRYLGSFNSEATINYKIIIYGFLCSYIGLLVHALGANTFILIRVMEPLWLIVAIIVSIPTIVQNDPAVFPLNTHHSDKSWKRYG